jgi:hypothetical protein
MGGRPRRTIANAKTQLHMGLDEREQTRILQSRGPMANACQIGTMGRESKKGFHAVLSNQHYHVPPFALGSDEETSAPAEEEQRFSMKTSPTIPRIMKARPESCVGSRYRVV